MKTGRSNENDNGKKMRDVEEAMKMKKHGIYINEKVYQVKVYMN